MNELNGALHSLVVSEVQVRTLAKLFQESLFPRLIYRTERLAEFPLYRRPRPKFGGRGRKKRGRYARWHAAESARVAAKVSNLWKR